MIHRYLNLFYEDYNAINRRYIYIYIYIKNSHRLIFSSNPPLYFYKTDSKSY